MSAPATCFANTFPDQHALDYSGFNGTVCLVSHDQGFQLDIESCCATSTVRTFDACTEYCQVNDAQDFKQCVNGKVMNDTMLSPVCPEVVDGKLPDQEGAAARTIKPVFGYGTIGTVMSLAVMALIVM